MCYTTCLRKGVLCVKFCRLVGNPVCELTEATEHHCTVDHCISDQISSPNSKFTYPYTGVLFFRPPFLESRNATCYLRLVEESLMHSFKNCNLPVDSVYVNCSTNDSLGYLELKVSVFPSGHNHFSTTTISEIGFVLNLQTIQNPDIFGPSYFQGVAYPYFSGNFNFMHK
jgi:hypothetical protein